jgi:hypothetical protein
MKTPFYYVENRGTGVIRSYNIPLIMSDVKMYGG